MKTKPRNSDHLMISPVRVYQKGTNRPSSATNPGGGVGVGSGVGSAWRRNSMPDMMRACPVAEAIASRGRGMRSDVRSVGEKLMEVSTIQWMVVDSAIPSKSRPGERALYYCAPAVRGTTDEIQRRGETREESGNEATRPQKVGTSEDIRMRLRPMQATLQCQDQGCFTQLIREQIEERARVRDARSPGKQRLGLAKW